LPLKRQERSSLVHRRSSFFLIVTLAPFALEQSPLPTTSGTGFAGAPCSAAQTTTIESSTANDHANSKSYVTLLWRDAAGRTHQEHIQQSPSSAEYRLIVITDPVAGVSPRFPCPLIPAPWFSCKLLPALIAQSFLG
jgi:hypothetical protein